MAATILALMVMFVMNLLPASVLSVRLAENRMRAGQLAQNILEDSRRSFGDLVVGNEELPPVDEGAGHFRRIRQIIPVTDVPGNRLKEIRVTVLWVERGVEHKVERRLTLVDVRL